MRKSQNDTTAETLQNSLYARLVNSPSLYLICLDPEGYYTYVNPNFANKFAHLAANFVGVAHQDTICSEDQALSKQVLQQSLNNPEETFTLQVRKPAANGEGMWSFWEISALTNSHDEVTEIVCIGYDITESEMINRQRLEYTTKIDNIIDNLTDGLIVVDRNWRFLRVNKVAEQTINFMREQLLGKSFWEFIPDESQFAFPDIFRTAMTEGITASFEEYFPHLQHWYDITAYPSTEGLTAIFRDITEQKLAEEKLNDYNNKLLAIHNSTSDINILISPDYNVLSFNKVAEQSTFTLYKTQITIGQSIWEYILPGTEDEFQQCFETALNGEEVEVKVKLFFKPGLALWFRVRYFPVRDINNKLIGVAFNSTNIDEQQRQLEQLEEIAKLYSHEIRRPVATILGITQLVNIEELTFENREWFTYLKKTTLELDHVIHKIVRKTSEIN